MVSLYIYIYTLIMVSRLTPPLMIVRCTLTERPPHLVFWMMQPWMISDVWPANEYMFNAVHASFHVLCKYKERMPHRPSRCQPPDKHIACMCAMVEWLGTCRRRCIAYNLPCSWLSKSLALEHPLHHQQEPDRQRHDIPASCTWCLLHLALAS